MRLGGATVGLEGLGCLCSWVVGAIGDLEMTTEGRGLVALGGCKLVVSGPGMGEMAGDGCSSGVDWSDSVPRAWIVDSDVGACSELLAPTGD